MTEEYGIVLQVRDNVKRQMSWQSSVRQVYWCCINAGYSLVHARSCLSRGTRYSYIIYIYPNRLYGGAGKRVECSRSMSLAIFRINNKTINY